MIRTMLATTTLVLLATSSPAAAVTTGPGAKTQTKLTVSYMADAGFASAVVLSCDPAGGVHPAAAAACAVLTKVDGKPAKLKPAAAMCTLEYAPITAAVTGTWKGRPVNWSKKFGNRCDLTRTTGALFSF